MSDSNRVGLRFIEEETWNTLPGTPTMAPIRFTGESLIPNVENITSEEIRSDRMVTDLIQVSRSNTGGFDFELSDSTFDTLLQGALFGTWDSNVLKNSTVEYSYSIEKALLDIDEYFLFTGLMVNSFSMNLATSSIATGSFDFLGSACTLLQATNAATVTSATTTAVMNCMGNVAELKEGSSLTALTGIYVQEVSFTLANNLRPVYAVGSNTIQDVGIGKCDITGTLNAYFTSDRLFDKFLAGTGTALEFKIQDTAANYYIVKFPNVKFETNSVVAPGQDQDIIETLTWRALRDSVSNAMIQITRSA